MELDVKGLREQIENESRGLSFEEVEAYRQDMQSAKVRDMIGAKITTYQALRGENRQEVRQIAGKYMGLPITDILREQKKAENLLEDAENRLESFLEAHRKKALKQYKVGSMTEKQKEQHAEEYVKLYIMGHYAHENEDPKAYEAHKEYNKMKDEIAKLRTEKNAVLLAKDDFLEENRELIEEERKQARIRDIRKSGILAELGIAAEEEKEEQQAGEEEREGGEG